MIASARHILVPTEEQCLELKKKIEDGEDFAQVAKKFSQCPSSHDGGNLGEFGPGQMVRAFEDVVFSKDVEVGSVQGPVRTEFGFHLIEITSRS